jgi:hypothetical protein
VTADARPPPNDLRGGARPPVGVATASPRGWDLGVARNRFGGGAPPKSFGGGHPLPPLAEGGWATPK